MFVTYPCCTCLIFPHRSGLTAIGGFIPVTSLPEALRKSLDEDPITMTFGSNGFFGYSPCTPLSGDVSSQKIMWWSTWEVSPPPSRDTLLSDIRATLLALHGNWKSPHDTPNAPVFPSIILLGCGSESDTPATATAVEKNLLVLPRYITPRLPSWSSPSGKIILMGDAAHTMPPDAGQGVACAIEDAVAIAKLLKHYLSQGKSGAEAGDGAGVGDTLRKTAKAYEENRIERLAYILDTAKRLGNRKRQLSWFQEKLRDVVVGLFCKHTCCLYLCTTLKCLNRYIWAGIFG
jgi:2-polyprenyl-6-methoxyphenol hydroxylase-like FAD-dependent oxidoreductase